MSHLLHFFFKHYCESDHSDALTMTDKRALEEIEKLAEKCGLNYEVYYNDGTVSLIVHESDKEDVGDLFAKLTNRGYVYEVSWDKYLEVEVTGMVGLDGEPL